MEIIIIIIIIIIVFYVCFYTFVAWVTRNKSWGFNTYKLFLYSFSIY